jgi:TolB-like protein
MPIWSAEIKEIQILFDSFKGQLPDLEKELKPLITSEDSNVVLLYSRRCLEVIVTELCEVELKRPRKTEPLKGIIDKLNSEEKVPFHIITSMHSLNSLSTFGTHPKDFDQEQVKPVLNNLAIIIRWYLKYKDTQTIKKPKAEEGQYESLRKVDSIEGKRKLKKKLIVISGLLLACVIVVMALVVFDVIGDRKQPKVDKNLGKSIAVLPFKSLSDDPEKQYLADGIMDAILLHLSKIEGLRVISRTSVEQYRKTDKTVSTICQELGVAYLLEGSFQKFGDDARLIVQLIKTEKEGHEWADQYDRKWNDIFSVQSEVAQTIADELKAIVTPEEKKLIEKIPTPDLTAYEAYLKGEFYLYKATPNDLDTAMQYFELAKEKDPEFALAYAGIGNVWLYRQQVGFASPDEAGPKAMAAITRALELDNTIAEVHDALALMKAWGMWNWEEGEDEFKKAIKLNPNLSEAHAMYSHLLNITGRPKEAMEHIELALKLDPHNPMIKVWYSQDLLFVHRYDDVISVSREVFEKNPTMVIALDALFQALHLAGRYKEAFEVIKLYFSHMYKDFDHVFDQYDKLGYAGTLNLEGDTLSAQSKTNFILPSDIAYLYLFAGNKERALECLEQSYEIHDSNMPYITRPTYDSLRDEPRFQGLLRKLNLPFNN